MVPWCLDEVFARCRAIEYRLEDPHLLDIAFGCMQDRALIFGLAVHEELTVETAVRMLGPADGTEADEADPPVTQQVEG